MAFIELTEDEIAILSEAEKKQYDRQLKLHHERIAFVELLEKIESANYQYQKPEIKRIKPIRRIEIPKYQEFSGLKITLPENLTKRDGKKQAKLQQELRSKINAGLVKKCSISKFPAIKRVELPSELSYHGVEKIEVSAVADKATKPNIPVMQVGKFEGVKIHDFPEKMNLSLPEVAFEYERQPLNVTAPKVNIPSIKKFTGLSAVNISDVPTFFVGLAAVKKYTPVAVNSESVLNVKEKAASIMIKSPQLSYEFPKMEDVIVPKIPVAINQSESSISALQKRIANGIRPSVKTESIKVNILPKLSIKGYEPSKPNVQVPKIKATTIPDIKNVQMKPIDINVDVKPQAVELPMYKVSSIKPPKIVKTEVVKLNTPHITENDVLNVINRVINGI